MSTVRTVLQRAKTFALAHKFLSGIVILAVLGGGWWYFKSTATTTTQTRYILTTVQKGTIVSSISASGQVSASNQLDVKPKVSGELVWVGVKAGDTVHAGQAVMSIDNATAKQSLRSAQQSLAASKLQLQKDSAQAPIDYQKAQDALQTAKDDLSNTYNDTFNTLSTTFLDLPNVMTGAQNTIFGYDLDASRNQWNIDVMTNLFQDADRAKMLIFATSATSDYNSARAKYDANVLAYKQISRYASSQNLESMLAQAIDTTTAAAQALQSELNLIGTAIDIAQQRNQKISTVVSTLQSNARNYLSTANSDLTALLAQKKAIDTAKQTITTDQQNITLLQVGNTAGSNPISLQISQNNLVDQENNVAQLQTDLANYTITAPFDGTIAVVDSKVHDPVGTGTTVFTLITNQKIATLSLNEVDAAKIKLGNKATLTFDAIDALSLTGTINEIDPVGTVSQGVVSYNIKIAFDSQDARVKPGMTVNANIITDAHTDVLMVPSSAVKTQNGQSYVLAFSPALANTGGTAGVSSLVAPTQIPVEVGITNDTSTEILSGLSEGEQIVSRTAANTTTAGTATRTTTTTGAARGSTNIGGIRIP